MKVGSSRTVIVSLQLDGCAAGGTIDGNAVWSPQTEFNNRLCDAGAPIHADIVVRITNLGSHIARSSGVSLIGLPSKAATRPPPSFIVPMNVRPHVLICEFAATDGTT
jgi:hypothetical protein